MCSRDCTWSWDTPPWAWGRGMIPESSLSCAYLPPRLITSPGLDPRVRILSTNMKATHISRSSVILWSWVIERTAFSHLAPTLCPPARPLWPQGLCTCTILALNCFPPAFGLHSKHPTQGSSPHPLPPSGSASYPLYSTHHSQQRFHTFVCLTFCLFPLNTQPGQEFGVSDSQLQSQFPAYK